MKPFITGKVRDVYEADSDHLVIVTLDRISAFDVVLPTMIPQKGVALNQISNYWFNFTKNIVPNHIVATKLSDMPDEFSKDPVSYDKRTVLVKKLKMLPYEFIVRGYVFGSMWKEYSEIGSFCGQAFSREYELAEKLDSPMFTPSSKNQEGHDGNISVGRLSGELGADMSNRIRDASYRLYEACYQNAIKKGIIIADTKFEFGLDNSGSLVLADEIFTPDSRRFWDAAEYRVGESPKSYDKQFVRDWLIGRHLDGVSPAPGLPADIRDKTAEIYKECYRKITGKTEY